MNKNHTIANRQVVFIILHICVGTGILSLPRTISAVAKQDSLISILLGFLPWLLIIYIIYNLNKRFPDDTFIDYNIKIVGKIMGRMLSLIYILYNLAACAVITRIFITVLGSFTLPKTPIIYTTIILILLSYYLSNQGLKTLARLDEFLFFLLSPVFIVMLPEFTKLDILNFQPVFGSGVTNIIKGGYTTLFSYVGPEILLIIYPFIKGKEKSFKYSAIGLSIVLLTYLFIVGIVLGFYGSETLQFIVWPSITVLKGLNIPFFGRLEFVFIFFWIGIAFTTVSSYYFVCSFSLSQLLNINKKKTGAVLIPIVIILSQIPENIIEIYEYSDLIGKIGFYCCLIIPTILLIISFLKGDGKNK